VPVYAAEPPSLALVKDHATGPEEDSYLSLDAPGCYSIRIKQSEDGDELIVRLAEMWGKETTVNLKIPVLVSAVRRLNLVELPLENSVMPTFSGNTVQFKIKPHEIVTLGIK